MAVAGETAGTLGTLTRRGRAGWSWHTGPTPRIIWHVNRRNLFGPRCKWYLDATSSAETYQSAACTYRVTPNAVLSGCDGRRFVVALGSQTIKGRRFPDGTFLHS